MDRPRLPDRYQIVTLLGEGGMGQVWHAWDTVLDVPVAVKVIRPRVARRKDFRTRFSTEIALQARFHHPHLVPLHDAGQLPSGLPYVAMAYADQGSLGRFVPEGMPWCEARRLACELLEALADLHARGVVHLDLKPENVLLHTGLDRRRHAWVTDLGIARLLERPRPDAWGSSVAGTPAFMAPEQLHGRDAELGRRTDLYGVGAILARITGPHPVPRGLEELLLTLTHPLPFGRPALAADVRAALLRLGPPVAPLQTLPLPGLQEGATTWVTDIGMEPESPPLPQPDPDPAPPAPDEANWPRAPRLSPTVLPSEPPPETRGERYLRASMGLYAHREIPIVGRDDERRRLWDLARRVRQTGEPSVALVVGERGSGKSRLVDSVVRTLETEARIRSLGIRYHDPPGQTDGYVGAIHRLLRPWGEDRLQTQERLTRWFGGVLPGLPPDKVAEMATRVCHAPAGHLDPDIRGLAEQIVHWLLHARCWRGLTVLVIEDAHLALQRGEGLEIPPRFLNRSALGQPAPILLLCTLNSEALHGDPDLAQQVALLQDSGAVRLDLPRLNLEQTRTLLDLSIDLAPDLRDAVARRCEGNPLLARQLVQHWAEKGLLHEVGDLVYTLDPGVDPSEAIPEDTRDLYLDRAESVIATAKDPGEVRRSLHRLALAGGHLPVPFLEAIAGEHTGFLRACGLLRTEDGHLRFDHQFLREALLQQAREQGDPATGTPPERYLRDLHADLAEAWSTYQRVTGADAEVERAEALLRAGRPERAFSPLARAAIQQKDRGNLSVAVRLGEAAIEAMHQDTSLRDHTLASRLLSETAQACMELPRPHRAQVLAERALNYARSAADRARGRTALGTVHQATGDWPRARRLFQEAVEELESTAHHTLLAEALDALGLATLRYGLPVDAIMALERAVEVARRTEQSALLGRVTRGLGMARARFGDLEHAVELCQEALGLARRSGNSLEHAFAHHALGLVELDLDRAEDSRRHLEQATSLFASSGAWARSQAVLKAVAEIHRVEGRTTETRKLLHLVADWGHTHHMGYEALDAWLLLLVLELMEDDLQAAAQASKHAARMIERVPSPQLHLVYHATNALLAARSRKEGSCRSSVERMQAIHYPVVADRDLAWTLLSLAREALQLKWTGIARLAVHEAGLHWRRLGSERRVREARTLSDRIRDLTATPDPGDRPGDPGAEGAPEEPGAADRTSPPLDPG